VRFALALACLAPASGRADKLPGKAELDRVATAIQAGDWGRASADCEDLVTRIAWRSESKEISAALLADLTARCAIAAAGDGDADLASFDWHVATLFDRATAQAVAAKLGREVELPALRAEVAVERSADGTRLASGLLDPAGAPIAGEGRPPLLRDHWDRSKLPAAVEKAVRRAGQPDGARLVVEFLLDPTGRPHAPRIVSATEWSPQTILWLLSWLREVRFLPARAAGAPVAILYDWVFPEGL